LVEENGIPAGLRRFMPELSRRHHEDRALRRPLKIRMPREGVAAVEKTGNLSPMQIRDYAISGYSLGAVAPQFDHWLERLSTLFGDGWNS
jgi:hypothetical protein